jgi:hypothetical protein
MRKSLWYLLNKVCPFFDMGDPVGAASHALQSLKPEGTAMIVEPFANDKTEDNLNPIGRMFYAASTMVCVPGSMAFNGPALGAQAGEGKIAETLVLNLSSTSKGGRAILN